MTPTLRRFFLLESNLLRSESAQRTTSESSCVSHCRAKDTFARSTTDWRPVGVAWHTFCDMCNASLRESVLASNQKTAVITSVVKKSGLDPDKPQCYRPISNLTFMSKVIERIVAEQTRGHLASCDLMPPVQSAYRQGQSTETALMEVIAHIIDAADNQMVIMITRLWLLDMIAAFNSVDHNILLCRLTASLDKWCSGSPFLTDRTRSLPSLALSQLT